MDGLGVGIMSQISFIGPRLCFMNRAVCRLLKRGGGWVVSRVGLKKGGVVGGGRGGCPGGGVVHPGLCEKVIFKPPPPSYSPDEISEKMFEEYIISLLFFK